MKSDKEIYEFCKGNYYSDIENNIRWEPFEEWATNELEKQINQDVISLKQFMQESEKPALPGEKEYIVRWKKCYSILIEAKDRDQAIEKAAIYVGENPSEEFFESDEPMDAELN